VADFDLQRFARNHRKLREKAGLSQRELAEKIGCTRANVAHVEAAAGTYGLPAFVACCAALGCTSDQLLRGQR
jgi:transcriptional regulator with XRE-family HTH domain